MPLTRQRTQALLPAICVFRLLPRGFTSRDLRHHLAPLPGTTADAMTSGQLSYDLRRLRYHGFIQRTPRTHRYQVTSTGLRNALFLTRACSRLLHGGLAEIAGPLPTQPSNSAPLPAPAKQPSTTWSPEPGWPPEPDTTQDPRT
jgi:hypothetical protein